MSDWLLSERVKSIAAIFITLDGAAKRTRVPWPPLPVIYFELNDPPILVSVRSAGDGYRIIPKRRAYELEVVEYGGRPGTQDPDALCVRYRECLENALDVLDNLD